MAIVNFNKFICMFVCFSTVRVRKVAASITEDEKLISKFKKEETDLLQVMKLEDPVLCGCG